MSDSTTQAAAMLEINPALDRARLASSFAEHRRIQVKDVLTPESASAIARLLIQNTPWGMSWNAAEDGPHKLRREQSATLPPDQMRAIGDKVGAVMQGQGFAFVYSQYQMYDASKGGWSASPAHDRLMDDINSAPFLDLVREVTGLPQLKWADAQATLYAPNQFLSWHQDIKETEGWLVAYVLNFSRPDWRPDWGGYLNFFDKEGDIVAGYRPRFNSLNMFLVPQDHNVSYVPPFAPYGRFAITGWFRDR